MILNQFDIASGSIVGTDHRQQFVWKNNQDALAIRQSDQCIVAVVADGCGEGAFSEFGARLGANMLAHRLTQLFGWQSADGADIKREVLDACLVPLHVSLVASMAERLTEMQSDSRSRAVNDHFLFTLLALVITPHSTFVLGVGDGVYAVNGEVRVLGPFPKNEPPYIAYGGLVESSISPDLARLAVHTALPTADLQSICIGTDGAGDFARISDRTLPGKKELVGPLSQFWTNDAFFRKPEAVRRRLNLINNSLCIPDWKAGEMNEEHGRLKDDTTLIVVRRRSQPKE